MRVFLPPCYLPAKAHNHHSMSIMKYYDWPQPMSSFGQGSSAHNLKGKDLRYPFIISICDTEKSISQKNCGYLFA